MPTVQLSFIVITYGRRDDLYRCLESTYRQEGLPAPYEVILVNNGPQDVLRVPPAPEGVHLRLEQAPRNLGVCGGRNLGIRLAQGDLLVFIDDDAEWHTSQEVGRMLAYFAANPRCAGLCGRVLQPDGQMVEHYLPYPDKAFARALTTPTPAPYFLGTAHALRAAALKDTDLYPERYFYAMEEIDLSLRLIDAGWEIAYLPEIAVRHYAASQGRLEEVERWHRHSLNKARMAWRLLPLPYPLTTTLIWCAAALVRTRRVGVALGVLRDLWAERALLRQERRPIRPATVHHLRRLGARLLY